MNDEFNNFSFPITSFHQIMENLKTKYTKYIKLMGVGGTDTAKYKH